MVWAEHSFHQTYVMKGFFWLLCTENIWVGRHGGSHWQSQLLGSGLGRWGVGGVLKVSLGYIARLSEMKGNRMRVGLSATMQAH